MRALKGLMVTLFGVAILYGIILYFFGVTLVSTQHDGTPITARVYVGGEYKGETPLKLRLGPGRFSIRIVPPDGYRGTHSSWEFFTMGLGGDFNEYLTPVKYRVMLRALAGKSADFEVTKDSGEIVAACQGPSCEVPLPSPGRYNVSMVEFCDDATLNCRTGNETFTITPFQEEAKIDWN